MVRTIHRSSLKVVRFKVGDGLGIVSVLDRQEATAAHGTGLATGENK
jgi:hypothetical protein